MVVSRAGHTGQAGSISPSVWSCRSAVYASFIESFVIGTTVVVELASRLNACIIRKFRPSDVPASTPAMYDALLGGYAADGSHARIPGRGHGQAYDARVLRVVAYTGAPPEAEEIRALRPRGPPAPRCPCRAS